MGAMASELPTSPLFTQPFIWAQFIENIKTLRHWPLCGESPVTGEFPAQMASNAENISIWWPHHDTKWNTSVIVHTQSITQRTYVMVTSLYCVKTTSQRHFDVTMTLSLNDEMIELCFEDVFLGWWLYYIYIPLTIVGAQRPYNVIISL